MNHLHFARQWLIQIVVPLALVGGSTDSILGQAEPAHKPEPIALGESGLQVTAPATWQTKPPRSRIVQYEFSIPSEKEDLPDVRITVMQAGGGIDANVQRWLGQFTQPDGVATEATLREKREIAGQEVHFVDIAGTYKDQPGGPRGPSTMRPDYRMLAAIIPTEAGTFFVKMVGHQDMIAGREVSFAAFLASLKPMNTAE